MTKSLMTGAIPIGLFMYLGVFHMEILFYIIMIGGLALASYLIGEAFREEFGDLSGKKD
jgi:hypothetical protein